MPLRCELDAISIEDPKTHVRCVDCDILVGDHHISKTTNAYGSCRQCSTSPSNRDVTADSQYITLMAKVIRVNGILTAGSLAWASIAGIEPSTLRHMVHRQNRWAIDAAQYRAQWPQCIDCGDPVSDEWQRCPRCEARKAKRNRKLHSRRDEPN